MIILSLHRDLTIAALCVELVVANIGASTGSLTIDWPALIRFKRSLIDSTPKRTEQAWAKIGVEQFHGRAQFVDPTSSPSTTIASSSLCMPSCPSDSTIP